MPEDISEPMKFDETELLRDAVRCLAVNPGLHSLSVSGPSGVGKTCRTLSEIADAFGKRVIRIKSDVTADDLFGSADVESMLHGGRLRLIPGILQRCDGGILFIDSASSFDSAVLTEILGVAKNGRIHTERGGVSFSVPVNLSVAAVFNTEETDGNGKILQLFDMHVAMFGTADVGSRAEVILSDLADGSEMRPSGSPMPDADPASASVLSDAMGFVGRVCASLGCRGFDTELAVIRVAKSLAALSGKTSVDARCLEEALYLCVDGGTVSRRPQEKSGRPSGKPPMSVSEQGCGPSPGSRSAEIAGVDAEGAVFSDECGGTLVLEDVIVRMEERIRAEDILEDLRGYRESELRFRNLDGDGRAVGSRVPKGDCPDIDILATVKAAAPFQRIREKPEGAVLAIEDGDYREKRRSNEQVRFFLFLIDSSGSLVARNRIRKVKELVNSTLCDHFDRRDRAAIASFDGRGIGILMQPTHSVGKAEPILDSLSVGSKTPLSEALVFTRNYIGAYRRRHPSDLCRVMLFTDGDANVPLDPKLDPFGESLEIAREIAGKDAVWTVVDTGSARGKARILSEALSADYMILDDVCICRRTGTSEKICTD